MCTSICMCSDAHIIIEWTETNCKYYNTNYLSLTDWSPSVTINCVRSRRGRHVTKPVTVYLATAVTVVVVHLHVKLGPTCERENPYVEFRLIVRITRINLFFLFVHRRHNNCYLFVPWIPLQAKWMSIGWHHQVRSS